MKVADWKNLYKIGLGISVFLFLFSTILIIFQSFFIIGLKGYGELGLSSLFVGAIFFVISNISLQRFEKEEKTDMH
jgi:hypothetical protein